MFVSWLQLIKRQKMRSLILTVALVCFSLYVHADVNDLIDRGIYDTWGVEDVGTVYDDYVDSGLPVAVLFLDVIEKDQNEYAISELEKASKEFVGKVLFMHGDGRKYKSFLESLGGDVSELPELVITDYSKKVVYSYAYPDANDVFEHKAIAQWINNVLQGKVTPKKDEL